jgi:sodium-coupled neutral amino acid transporter 11
MKFVMRRCIFTTLIATATVAQFMVVATDGALGSKGILQGTSRNNFSRRAGQNGHLINRKVVQRLSARDGPDKLQIRGGAKDTEQKASISSSIFNLVNNVAGAGILTLSSGVASGTGSIPAIIICVALAALSGHCFSIIGEACELTGEANFKGLWKRTIGENSTYLVDSMIAIMCLSCSVIYSGILGDVFTPLLKQVGFPDQWNGRTSNILVITTVLLLPLSLIKDLSALAFTSILGFASILYTVLFINVRYFDGSYSLAGGKFLQDGLIVSPLFEKASLWNIGFKSLVLASNFGLAYIAHYNAPNFYRSLKNTNSKRFRSMVNASFFILTILYTATMMAGHATFGDVCQGNILLNYHPSDILSTFGRVATG